VTVRACRTCGWPEGPGHRIAPEKRTCHRCRDHSRGKGPKPQPYVASATPARPAADPDRTPPVDERRAYAPPPAFVLPSPTSGTRRVLFIPDCHFPNVHEAAWALMLRAAHRFRPDVVVILGDFLDGESVSLHEPDAPARMDLETELVAVRDALDQLDELKPSLKIYVEGNHEQRLSRYLARNAPGVYRSMSVPEALDLGGRDWKWVPYRRSIRLGHVRLTHDTGSAGMNAHRSSAKVSGGSTIIGHTHRMAYEVTGRLDDAPYLAAMLGWLGDARAAAGYMHEAKAAEWVSGFGVGLLDDATGILYLQPVPIVNGKCWVAGEMIT